MRTIFLSVILLLGLTIISFGQNNICSPGKIIINEVYSDPTPSNGLPELEYLELFNTCSDTLSLVNWKITDGSSTGSINWLKLPPNDFLILCQDKTKSSFTSFGKVCGVTTWPSLNNLSDSLTLLDQDGQIIDVIVYDLNSLPDKTKIDGGWSVEVVDPWLHCKGFENWRFSNNALGGTPGSLNSVFANTPDIVKPKVLKAYTTSSLQLTVVFNEPMDKNSLINGNYIIQNNQVEVVTISKDQTKINLTFSDEFQVDQIYELKFQSITDCNLNEVDNNTIQFSYDINPPQLKEIVYNSTNSITCVFDEPLDKASTEILSHFSLNNYTPTSSKQQGDESVRLEFSNLFNVGEANDLNITGLIDLSGNVLSSSIKTNFIYFTDIDTIVVYDAYLLGITLKVKPDPTTILKENFSIDQDNFIDNISFSTESPEKIVLQLGKPLKANSWLSVSAKSLKTVDQINLQTPLYKVFYDTKSPQISQVVVMDSSKIQIVFDEKIDLPSAVAVHNFEVNHSQVFPSNVTVLNDSSVILFYENPFLNEVQYTLLVNNIQDRYKNKLAKKINTNFVYDKKPPEILFINQYSGHRICIRFSEQLVLNCLLESNFLLNNHGSPTAIYVAPWDSCLIWLNYPSDLSESSEHLLTFNNLMDKNGNEGANLTFTFSTIHPKVADLQVVSPNEIKLIFSEEINLTKALNKDLYLLNNTIKPSSVMAVSKKEILYEFPITFIDTNSIIINSIEDAFGNPSENEIVDFPYKKSIKQVSALDFNLVKLEFTESISSSSLNNVQIITTPDLGNIISSSLDPSNNNSIKILFGQTMQENLHYEIEVFGLQDKYGRNIPKEKVQFMFDRTPPFVSTIKAVLPQKIKVTFTEQVNKTTAENRLFYSIKNCGNPLKASVKNEKQDRVVLDFNCSLNKEEKYTLTISGVTDNYNNPIINQEITFTYLPPKEPSINDLIITEIMANSGSNSNFSSEYLEVYNRSLDTINLSGIVLADKTSSTILTEYFLPPLNYVVLAPSNEVHKFPENALGVSNWPTLNDQEDELYLKNRNGEIIFTIQYADNWYRDSSKSKGVSLEMIDTSNPCSGYHNWAASLDIHGGTPAQENSVKSDNFDQMPPKLIEAIASDPNSVVLFFNEKLIPYDLQNATFEFEPNAEISSITLSTLKWDKINIKLSQPLSENVVYKIDVSSLKDCANNLMESSSDQFQLCGKALSENILINEVLFDPRSGGVEFIELYNKMNYPVDLKKWQLKISDQTEFISMDHLVIDPGDFLVITSDPTILKADYPKSNENKFYKMSNIQTLVNTEGSIIILDSLNNKIDSLVYSEKMHLSLLKDTRGVSLERLSFDLPTTNFDNWKSASSQAAYATPGFKNSQMKMEHVQNGMFTVSPVSFSPDDPTGRNHTFINYEVDTPGYIANVAIYDRVGRLIKELAKNESIGTSGSIRWDGYDDSGNRVGTGYYIILIEAFDLNGNLLRFREKVAVAY